MTIRYQREGTTGYLLIDRADRRNAITLEMWQAIPSLLDEVEAEEGLSVLVVKSADDGYFSAGADIRELLANKDDDDWRAANHAAISETQHRLERCPLPTVAFIDGDCIGGGCGLALACDIRVATPRARFGITPAKLGIVYPFHDIKLLIELVGPGQAKRLLYTGDLIDVAEARDIGLIEIIASSPDALERAISKASGSSNRVMKALMRRILDGQVAEDAKTQALFADGFRSADFLEGAQAFIEKRAPDFS
ncbi:enoyl-CoA hydratase/isomerase family protein [Pontixanthobacter luteolus]|uniref:enoyl-CoA hydratase/isomerase family protein n=1 Tax=Pontixanthobacter luteolus TaxID=295089 RepID=UPI0023043B64|nr:enoyl-CoA hydratase/isomerase family protein [Pontixanthobacter luteolus]